MKPQEFVIGDLRDSLRQTLEALRDRENPLEIARARAICDVAGKIVDTARVEIDYLRVTNGKRGSGFIPIAEHDGPTPDAALPSADPVHTQYGIKVVEKLAAGTITTHRTR